MFAHRVHVSARLRIAHGPVRYDCWPQQPDWTVISSFVDTPLHTFQFLGIILNCDQYDATSNEDKLYTRYIGDDRNKQGGIWGNMHERHVDRVTHPELFEALKGSHEQEFLDDKKEQHAEALTASDRANNSADESACYFVKLPGHKVNEAQGNVRLNDCSMSTMSSNSHSSKGTRVSASSI